jgi:preprotein translocase subunit SecA
MTGTAREVAGELRSVYGLVTAVVPCRKPNRRVTHKTRCFTTAAAKWEYVVECVRVARDQQQPVLLGTCSVETSERLSERLTAAGLKHQVLNARQDSEEAEIVARAGQLGAITVATSMAGRGTDIGLGVGVAEHGGLRVIATEGAESRRIDRQLRGRAGRRGDPGSFEMVVCLEDDRLAYHLPSAVLNSCRKAAGARGQVPNWIAEKLLFRSQRADERQGARTRRALMSLEQDRDALLAFSGTPE